MSSVTVAGTPIRTFTHDGAGNITRDVRTAGTWGYAYNRGNRLSSVTKNGAAWATYVYNGSEQLAIRSTSAPGGPSGTVHYLYDLWGNLLAEIDGATGATLREYIWLPQAGEGTALGRQGMPPEPLATPDSLSLPIAVVADVNTATPKLWYVVTDHLFRPVELRDSAKALVWQAVWLPFGGSHSITGPASLDARFPGQWFQIETGLHYNWHRHYDPTTGRYTQPDPWRPTAMLAQQLAALMRPSSPYGFRFDPSLYSYARNNPLRLVDPLGLLVFFFGGGGDAVGGFGIDASGGLAIDIFNRNSAVFGTAGPALGFNLGASVFAGLFSGDFCDFEGIGSVLSFNLFGGGLSLLISQSGSIGLTLGAGPGLGFSYARTTTLLQRGFPGNPDCLCGVRP